MGSLPDLTERARPPSVPRPAHRTLSDPHRDKCQPPVCTISKKEWSWKYVVRPSLAAHPPRRRDSGSSSVGAASVKRLITRAPPKPPRALLRRFTLLCLARAFASTALLPFTALVGAGENTTSLALMHSVAAATAPVSPAILKRIGPRITFSVGYALVSVLLAAHAFDAPLLTLLPLYAITGLTFAPVSLAYASASTKLAHSLSSGAQNEDVQRTVVLRRALRALRASRDGGLLIGALILGGSIALWPSNEMRAMTAAPIPNITVSPWPPPEEFEQGEEYEESSCGASGCPDDGTDPALSRAGFQAVCAVWAALSACAVVLSFLATSGTPFGRTPEPARAKSTQGLVSQPQLVMPMALFIGMQEGFFFTSYIKWYVVCVGGWGGAWISLSGAGALQSVAAATLSMAAARGRRGALVAGGAAAHASLMLALLRWRAAKSDLALPAVVAAAWGACGALWDTLQGGIAVGVSQWRRPWALALASRSAGIAAACVARASLCVSAQLAVMAAALLPALLSHGVFEWRARALLQRART